MLNIIKIISNILYADEKPSGLINRDFYFIQWKYAVGSLSDEIEILNDDILPVNDRYRHFIQYDSHKSFYMARASSW